jgi:hypothetical protein
MRRTWWVTGAAAAVVLAATVLVTWDDLRDGVASGTLVETFDLDLAAGRLTGGDVMLPTGRLAVTVGEPTRELPRDATATGSVSRRDVEKVGDFGRYLGVGWALTRPRNDDRFAWDEKVQRQVEVVLVADGTRHDLRAGESDRSHGRFVTTKTVYLALPGEPRDLSIEVTYDGLTQKLDPRTGERETGVAQPLYGPAGAWTASPASVCASRFPGADGSGIPLAAPGFEFQEKEDSLVRCVLAPPVPSPYVPGAGWARPGRTWLSVLLVTRPPVGTPVVYWPDVETEPNALYALKLQISSVTLGGAAPDTTRRYFLQDEAQLRRSDTTGAYLVFDVAPSTAQRLELRQRWVSSVGDTARADAPTQAVGTASLTVTLGPATR